MKVAWLNLRHTEDERQKAFFAGLARHGYKTKNGIPRAADKCNLFITWNRIGIANHVANDYQQRGIKVLVAENASWGNKFVGDRWYTIASNYHNTAAMNPYYGPERFDELRVKLKPWRTEGETVILAQRGIGSPPTAMPRDWPARAFAKYGGRIRKHPGNRRPDLAKPLDKDLKRCGKAITWGSGAALWAIMNGIPTIHNYKQWIGGQDNTDEGRLDMLRRLAWHQWRMSEIESGEVFERLLNA